MEKMMVDNNVFTFNTGESAIETHGLSKHYRGVKVVNEVNLRIPRNSITGFLGPN